MKRTFDREAHRNAPRTPVTQQGHRQYHARRGPTWRHLVESGSSLFSQTAKSPCEGSSPESSQLRAAKRASAFARMLLHPFQIQSQREQMQKHTIGTSDLQV
ncbi:hypothetical protein P0D88_51215, partial [Paraburkholderia sp. RL18-103-BIB-C]|uniref:hypothetical protein n=1 Tax=unclassified Paraburkholderia TaxID=2615204 RepID=UPI0038B79F5F